MIEKFNFYDIYGYLIPGFVLLGVLALPWLLTAGLAAELSKFQDLSAALAALIAAYVVGHLLHVVSSRVIPETQAIAGNDRYPSDWLLDDADFSPSYLKQRRFPSKLRIALRAGIERIAGIDVGDEPVDSRGSRRFEAFLLCRSRLNQSDIKSYTEQFQGIYILIRGICAAATIGFAFDVGWLYSRLLNAPSGISGIIARTHLAAAVAFLCAAILVILVRPPLDLLRAIQHRLEGALILVSFTCAGALAADASHVSNALPHSALPLMAAAVLLLLTAFWTFTAYHGAAILFAKSVYRDFYLFVRTKHDSGDADHCPPSKLDGPAS